MRSVVIGLLCLVVLTQASYAQSPAPVELGGDALRVRVSGDGEIRIDAGGDSYTVESCFSYPGVDGAWRFESPDGRADWQQGRIGWNGFPRGFTPLDNYPDVGDQLGNEPSWKPVVRKSGNTITVEAEGDSYRLVRTVRLSGGRIDINDQFTNKRKYPTAIVPRHILTAGQDILERFHVYGMEVAANPTIFLSGARSSLGLLMQDNISRRGYRLQFPEEGNRGGFQINRFVLDVGKTHTFSWSIYVMEKGQGYFDFVNRVRKDWKVNVTIDGPYIFGYLNPEGDDIKFHLIRSEKRFSLNQVSSDPAEMRKFREYLQWRGVTVLALAPWLDYDPGAMDHVLTRDEYRKLMAAAIPVIRKASPGIKIVGCVETPYVSIEDKQGRLPKLKAGESFAVLQEELTPEQVRAIEEELGDMAECLIRDAAGRPPLELYVRGGKQVAPAAMVYPEIGNARYRLLMEQAKFLVEEIGMDGAYFDMFAIGQIGSYRNYAAWDGMSADIDFNTGEWHTPHVNCALVAVPAKLKVLDYLLSRGKTVFANRHSTSNEEQTLQVSRFTETGGGIKLDWPVGDKPPLIKYLCFSHLSTPLGFGLPVHPEGENPTHWIMRGLIAYLRHGMVFCQGDTGPLEPPMTEENKDAFTVMKHMYPITPVELGEGFIVGKERILTAVSMDRVWKSGRKPTVMIFDTDARPLDLAGRCTVKQEKDGWRVKLDLKDWAEVAVVR